MIGNGERGKRRWLDSIVSVCTDRDTLLLIGGGVVSLSVIAFFVVGVGISIGAAVLVTGGIVLLVAGYVAAIRFTESVGLTIDQRDPP